MCTEKSVFCAFIYLDRYLHCSRRRLQAGGQGQGTIELTMRNGFQYALKFKHMVRLLLVSLVVAVKFHEDLHYSN